MLLDEKLKGKIRESYKNAVKLDRINVLTPELFAEINAVMGDSDIPRMVLVLEELSLFIAELERTPPPKQHPPVKERPPPNPWRKVKDRWF